ncbi:MAG: chromate transporter [Candidatus Omnitrophota bacterium]|nr:chromate transporter [Candidatus Omnitrophota bacterium]
MILINLFFVFLRVGLFAIGGAYSFLPLIEKEVVQRYQWLTKEEFLDVLGIVKVFPGAISIKFATYTGYKIGGLAGAILANLGNILAPVLFIVFASIIYLKYKDNHIFKSAFDAIRLSIFAMIIAVAFQTINLSNLIQIKSLLIIVASFIIFFYTKINPAIIIILAGITGVILR